MEGCCVRQKLQLQVRAKAIAASTVEMNITHDVQQAQFPTYTSENA